MDERALFQALSSLNFSGGVKLLDDAIKTRATKVEQTVDASLQQLYYMRGFCLQKLELFRKALKDYDSAKARGSSDPKVDFRRGQVLHRLGRTQEAEAAWRAAAGRANLDTDVEILCSVFAALKDPNCVSAQACGPSLANGSLGNNIAASNEPTPELTRRGSSHRQASTLHNSQQENTANGTAGSQSTNHWRQLSRVMDPDSAVQKAVEQINSGQWQDAVDLLDAVVKEHPKNLGARVARGTARALQRKLESAIDDFSEAIEIMPSFYDSWKRRGQARSALADYQGALSDLERAIQLTPDPVGKSDSHTERGVIIFQKLRDYRNAKQELKKAVNLHGKNVQAWNMLGLCCTSLGDIKEGVAAYGEAIRLEPNFKEAYFNLCQALKEAGFVKEAEEAYKKGRQAEKKTPTEPPHFGAYRVMASMYQGMGSHLRAVEILSQALNNDQNEQKLECYYLRAACYHALGYHKKAVRDYMRCMDFENQVSQEDPVERHQLVIVSFYQKEMAAYIRSRLDTPVDSFCPDIELNPIFKELWCKKLGPTQELIASYTMQSVSFDDQSPAPPRLNKAQLELVLSAADLVGSLLQNDYQGFLPNKRQQRAAGCAALELAQAVRRILEARKENKGFKINSLGASGGKGEPGDIEFNWREAMDIIVKWRQLSEPNDQVVWVDLLTPSEFEAGFGSHTPMFSGQTKCVRYYMNFERALKKHKEVLLKDGKAYNASNEAIPVDKPEQQAAIRAAKTAQDMYNVIKEDTWVVVPIASMAYPETTIEGTRLTLVKMHNQPDAHEFSIRTPVTPPRWRQFEAELKKAWNELIDAMVEGDRQTIAKKILTYTYYWYNFMPLARGTAAVGYTTMLALFWAAAMPVRVTIPTDYQVDWEAILERHPDIFAAELSQWFVPKEARPLEYRESTRKGSKEVKKEFVDPDSVPMVCDVLNTMRKRLEALNGPDAPRI